MTIERLAGILSLTDLSTRMGEYVPANQHDAAVSALAAENARLRDALVSLRDRLQGNPEMTAWEAYDSFYQALVDEALSLAPAKKENEHG